MSPPNDETVRRGENEQHSADLVEIAGDSVMGECRPS